MTVLSVAQARQYAQSAGFSGNALDTIVAIAQCESGLDTNAVNIIGNTPQGSIDRGVMQINSYWHKEVPNTCAFDPMCSFQQSFRISGSGTQFTQWETYKNQCYKNFMPGGSRASADTQSSSQPQSDGGNILTSIQQSLSAWLADIGVFLLALMLIVLGILLLGSKQVGNIVKS